MFNAPLGPLKGRPDAQGHVNDLKKTMFYGAKPEIFRKAEMLRSSPTPTEDILWESLRNKQLGVKIRRQHPIDEFIADFYCHSARLVVELDGKYHDVTKQRKFDQNRDQILKEHGIKVLRFLDDQILDNLEIVIKRIEVEIKRRLKYSA